MNEQSVANFEIGRKWAIYFGSAVYLGVVLLFLAFYETLMVKQFEGDKFFMIIARVGALLVSANSIALPLALHFWTVSKGHKFAGIVFYAGDIILMALNVLSSVQNVTMPAWIVGYGAYAPASIIYVLFGWAILFMTDPGQRALIDLQESILRAQTQILARVNEHLNSEEGMDRVIAPVAAKLGARIFNERRLIGENRSLSGVTSDTNSDELKTLIGDLVSQELSKSHTMPAEVTPKVTPTSHTKTPEVTPNSHTKSIPIPIPPESQGAAPFGSNGRG